MEKKGRDVIIVVLVAEKTHGASSLNDHSKTCPAKLRSDAPKYDHIADREKMS